MRGTIERTCFQAGSRDEKKGSIKKGEFKVSGTKTILRSWYTFSTLTRQNSSFFENVIIQKLLKII